LLSGDIGVEGSHAPSDSSSGGVGAKLGREGLGLVGFDSLSEPVE
jgi:hypothetical protein